MGFPVLTKQRQVLGDQSRQALQLFRRQHFSARRQLPTAQEVREAADEASSRRNWGTGELEDGLGRSLKSTG